jgi:hypothetical protein
MTLFTVLGFVFYVVFCFQLGYQLGALREAKNRTEALFTPVMSEVETLAVLLREHSAKVET